MMTDTEPDTENADAQPENYTPEDITPGRTFQTPLGEPVRVAGMDGPESKPVRVQYPERDATASESYTTRSALAARANHDGWTDTGRDMSVVRENRKDRPLDTTAERPEYRAHGVTLAPGDRIYARRSLSPARDRYPRDPGREFVEYRRLTITEFSDGGDWMTVQCGSVRYRLHAERVAEALGNDTVTRFQSSRPECMNPEDTAARTYAERVKPEPDSPTDLTFRHVSGEGAKATLNAFLNGGWDGRVDHALGGVGNPPWVAGFVATYHGEIISAAVLTNHPNPDKMRDGEVWISRLANHPVRPPNTSSWMIARVREWAAEQGYERISANAGVGENGGTCYAAAGFECVGVTDADGSRWAESKPNGSEIRDGGTWTRSRWVYDL